MTSRIITLGILLLSSPLFASSNNHLPLINSPSSKAGTCSISLMDGMSGKTIPGKIVSTTKAARSTQLTWGSADKFIRAKVNVVNGPHTSIYKVTVSYSGSKPSHRLLKLSLALPITMARNVSFWDGLDEHKWDGKSVVERDNIEYTFPVSCVWNNKNGLAVGFTPDTLTSSLHSGVRLRSAICEIFYETKLVVDSNHPQTVTYVVYKFRPTFGYLDAVQTYYDMFPKWFQPVDGIDQRVYGSGGYFISSDSSLRMQLHTGRRVGLDWEWVYAPWVRSADYYPEKADWIEGRDVIRHYKGYGDEYKGTWEEYNRVRKTEIDQGDKTTAMFYYLLVKDGNLDLVTKEYPDAQSVLKNGMKSTGGMNALVGEKTTYIFPYGTSMAERIESELRKVVSNYQVSGFSFDMANHGIDDYGPAQLKYGVARSFDENGKIYTPDTLVGVCVADAIHRMKRDSKPMGVIMNQAISRSQCFPVFHADAVMYEQGPAMNSRNVMPLRLLSGRKPMTFWGSVECARLNGGIRWDYMADPEMGKKIIDQLSQHYLFTCLRIGASAMTWAARDIGYDWLPTINDLKKAGWNPAPAVLSTSKDLWIGRFGSGMGTIITISNPKREPIKADLTVLSSYLGDGAYAFVSDQGQSITQQVSKQYTKFSINLQPKEIMVLRTYEIMNAGNGVKMITSRDQTTDSVGIQISGVPSGVTIKSSDRDHFGFGFIKADGLTIGDKQKVSKDGFEIKLASAKNRRIGLTYEPASRFLSPKDDVVAFYSESDALDKNSKMCIVIPDNASRTERTVAEQLESYYSFVKAYRERPGEGEPAFMSKTWERTSGVPILTCSQADESSYSRRIVVGKIATSGYRDCVLTKEDEKTVIQFDGGFVKTCHGDIGDTMWIGGKTDSEVRRMADIYFRLMDRQSLGDIKSAINWVPKGY